MTSTVIDGKNQEFEQPEKEEAIYSTGVSGFSRIAVWQWRTLESDTDRRLSEKRPNTVEYKLPQFRHLSFIHLLQIQPILHIIPGQPISNPTLNQRNKRGDNRAEPEGRRGGPVGGKNIESHGQTGKQAGSHRINSRGYSGKDSADQVEKDSHADKDPHGGQNFMAVEAVADGDTHIIKQDTGHL